MQSLLQYRRLRADIEQDLSRSRQATRAASSAVSISTPNSETAQDGDTKESGLEHPAQPYLLNGVPTMPGVTVSRPDEKDGNVIFAVGWREIDPNNPKDWSMRKKWMTIVTTCIISAVLTIPTSIDGPTQDAFNAHFEVNNLAGSMTTGKHNCQRTLEIN